MAEPSAIAQWAAAWGIETHVLDGFRRRRPAPERTLLAMLRAMGAEEDGEGDFSRAAEERKLRAWRRPLPPAQVVDAHHRFTCAVHVPREIRQLRWTLITEEGRTRQGEVAVSELPVAGRMEEQGRIYLRCLLQLGVQLAPGYHHLEVSDGAWHGSGRLIAAPPRCYVPEAMAGAAQLWGLTTPLHALRSPRDWGIGQFGDLVRWIDLCADAGAALAGAGPLHALSPQERATAWGMRPAHRGFLNELCVDVEAVPEFGECEPARTLVFSDEFQRRVQALRGAQHVDGAAVALLKQQAMELLYEYFRSRHLADATERGRAFRDFQQGEGEALRRYAVFAALREHFYMRNPHDHDWRNWPREYHQPQSPAVEDFAATHAQRVEYFEYLQWCAHQQLEDAGAHSLDRHLPVGVGQELALGTDPGSAETWTHCEDFALGVTLGESPDPWHPDGLDWGLAPWLPHRLEETGYAPWIALLRANMRHAGALCVEPLGALLRQYWIPDGARASEGASVRMAHRELLAILALESQRNQCMVFGPAWDMPAAQRSELTRRAALETRSLYRQRGPRATFLPPSEYPVQSVAQIGNRDLPPLAAFWSGRDLNLQTASSGFASEDARAKYVVRRAMDRAHLLLALEAENLLPPEVSPDPATAPEVTPALMVAVHALLARAPSKMLLVHLHDVLGSQEVTYIPSPENGAPGARLRHSLDLEQLSADSRLAQLAAALREAGRGASFPEPSELPARAPEGASDLAIPTATYRVQLHRDFTFRQVTEIVPYLARLGISHLYCSPFLKARPGSPHGYDIVDHGTLNPEIGDLDAYRDLVETLKKHDMGIIADIVPNHMGVGGNDNTWWLDVLENGQASVYGDYFDIDWEPANDALHGKVLLPVLGNHYGEVLAAGELRLTFDAERGEFSVRYYDHRFPIDPATYPPVLNYHLEGLVLRLGGDDPALRELQALANAFGHLPSRDEQEPARREERHRDKEVHKAHLAELCSRAPAIAQYIEAGIAVFNGTPGQRESYAALHALLEQQAYRLAYWRVAADDINYRRFFDINDLAGLRQEKEEVLRNTHRLLRDLIARGWLHGLRIDHPDGLYDPLQYFERLQQDVRSLGVSIYLVVEKILATFEYLREDWPVHGTTGYDFVNLVNGLFVRPDAERELDRLYTKFIEERAEFDTLVYHSKRLIIKAMMSSELHVLTNLLHRIAEADPATRDFTFNGLREALTEVVACFPVYRTYIRGGSLSAEDRRYVDWSVAQAKRRRPAGDVTVFDFIRRIVTLEAASQHEEQVARMVMKLQQYTAPIMAKGLEDTAFYRYGRLVSLNEVGGDPRRFAVTLAAWHRANQERVRRWPHAMLTTSTHDTKRSEDVRTRIDVISEITDEWRARVVRWHHLNRQKKRLVDGVPAPSRNDEYFYYQNLLGVWPWEDPDAAGLEKLRERMEAFMLKAVREAKVHTSWINPHPEYEAAVSHFVAQTLTGPTASVFLADFLPLQKRVARWGAYNSLSQVLLKCTAPGVPDFYQGNDLWDLSLVDPDNRRPVDYALRERRLQELETLAAGDVLGAVREFVDSLCDGRVKLYVTWRTLRLRRERPKLFQRGDYIPLAVRGARAEHVCAYARHVEGEWVIVVAPRWFSRLGDGESLPVGVQTWGDTWLELPKEAPAVFIEIFSGEPVERKKAGGLEVAEILRGFVVALLHGRDETAQEKRE